MAHIVIGLVVAFLMVTQTEAASIKVWSNDYVGAMRIEGEIEIGDAKKFYDAVKQNPYDIYDIKSPIVLVWW